VLHHSYYYDRDGRRARRIINSAETWHIYGIGGESVAEYAAGGATNAPQKEYGYRGGQLLITAESNGTVKWLVGDQLGTPRMVVDKSGALSGTGGIVRHDYLPFGEEISAGVGIRSASYGYGTDTVRQKYTGKERDGETGLDYFQARYYSSTQGRFTSADLPTADLVPANPQSMNRYAYVRNNPCKNIDPNGRCSAPAGLKRGQVGICVEAFIATKNLPGAMARLTGAKGDNRGPSGNDPNLTSRIHVELAIDKIYSPKEGHRIHAKPATAGISEAAGISMQGTAYANITNVKADDKAQTTQLTLTGTAQNGFAAAGIPGAPGGTIDFKLDFTVSSEGKVDINLETSTTKEYPTYEAYSYEIDDKGNVKVTELFVRPEKEIDALRRGQTPIEKKDK